jgi:hypothetical protein
MRKIKIEEASNEQLNYLIATTMMMFKDTVILHKKIIRYLTLEEKQRAEDCDVESNVYLVLDYVHNLNLTYPLIRHHQPTMSPTFSGWCVADCDTENYDKDTLIIHDLDLIVAILKWVLIRKLGREVEVSEEVYLLGK